MSTLSAFSQWALDDARSAGERYLVFLVCEACRLVEHHRRPLAEQRVHLYKSVPWEFWQELYLNPLLLPEYGPVETERAAAMAPYLKRFCPDTSHQRRCIGDAGAVLRFFPALEEVALGNTDLRDLSFVAALPRLRMLRLSSGVLEDLGPLRQAGTLRELSLGFNCPGPPHFTPPLYWVDARPLGALEGLEQLTLHPNPGILTGLRFPRLHAATLSGDHCMQPDCGHLPEMPALRHLKLSGVQSLRGIGRFPGLRSLQVSGPLRDFGDITQLTELSCLELQTQDGWPRDITPLTTLPALLWASFPGEIPRNYWPLAQAPRLCELKANALTVQLDVQAINAVLQPWDGVFSLPEPRPVPRLHFISVAAGGDTSVIPKTEGIPEPDFLAHPKLFHLELIWMRGRLLQAGEAVMAGEAGEHFRCWAPAEMTRNRLLSISIQSLAAARRLPQILDAWRGTLALSRHAWELRFNISLRLTDLELDEKRRELLRRQRSGWSDPDKEEAQHERYKLTQQHLIDTQFLLRTSVEEGAAPDPEDFEPPDQIKPESLRHSAVPAGPSDEGKDEEKPEDDFTLKPFDEQEQNPGNGDDDDDDGPNVTTAPPPAPEPSFLDDPYEHPLADSYRVYAALTLERLYHHGHNLATLQELLGRGPDEYHPPLEEPRG